jgi:hypothetical protein
MLEVKTESGIKKYKEIEEDFDTFLVKADNEEIDSGIRYENSSDIVDSCEIIAKEDITANYSDWVDIKSYYKGVKVSCEDIDGKVCVSLSKYSIPEELKNEFTYEEYMVDRGTEWPPIKSSRYYKIVDADDVDLKRNVCKHIHKDFPINRYGVYQGISKNEYDELHIDYLAKRIITTSNCSNKDPIYRLFIGAYGYGYFDKDNLVDLDTIFEKIIPRAYNKLDQGDYGPSNFVRDLRSEAHFDNPNFYTYKGHRCTVIIDGKAIELSEEYRYYSYLQRHIKIKEYYERGLLPYSKMDLGNVWYGYTHRNAFEKYENNHNPVVFNGKTICDDLGAFAKKVRLQMEYFKQFDKQNK